MTKDFGDICDTPLRQVIKNPKFSECWKTNKDRIDICQDCEFRYFCLDCRAYLEYPKNLYSKPLKCGYNPYNGIWSKWSIDPLKQKAIDYYKLENLE